MEKKETRRLMDELSSRVTLESVAARDVRVDPSNEAAPSEVLLYARDVVVEYTRKRFGEREAGPTR